MLFLDIALLVLSFAIVRWIYHAWRAALHRLDVKIEELLEEEDN